MGHVHRADRRPRRGALIACRSRPVAVALAANLGLACVAGAQPAENERRAEPPDAPAPVFLAPVYEGGIRKNRGIHIPVNLRSGPERAFSAGYAASNSYLNPGMLVCRDRSCELDYATDHTGNLLSLDITQPVLGAFELGFSLGAYEMNEIPRLSLLHRLASDRWLRLFHENILHRDSLPQRSGAPDGRQTFTMTDLDGRRFTLDPGHRYALPLRVDLTRYFDIRQTATARMTLNAGAHLAYPLEGAVDAAAGRLALARGADLGLSVNFVRSRRITPDVSSTWHVQIARYKHDVHVVNPDSPRHGDDDMRSQYALTFGLRFEGSFDGKAPCSFVLGQTTNSAHYDKERYWAADPVVFEGGNNLRAALAGANDYGVVTFACEYRRRRYQVSLVEDIGGLSQLIDDDGAGTSYDPDFAVGFSVSWTLGMRSEE